MSSQNQNYVSNMQSETTVETILYEYDDEGRVTKEVHTRTVTKPNAWGLPNRPYQPAPYYPATPYPGWQSQIYNDAVANN